MIRTFSAALLTVVLAIPSQASLIATPAAELTARTLGPAAFRQTGAQLAFDGSRFLAAWTARDRWGFTSVEGALLDANGKRTNAATLLVDANGSAPAVAFGGGRFLVTWIHRGGGSEVLGRFVNADGSMSEVFPLGLQAAEDSLHAAFHDGVFLVTALAGPWLYATVIDGSGHVVAPAFIVQTNLNGFRTTPDLVVAAGTFVAVAATDDGHIVTIAIDEAGHASPARVIANEPNVFDLHAAARGDEMRVGWVRQQFASGTTIESVLVTPDAVIPQAPVFIDSRQFQELAADTNGYVFFYGDDEETISRRNTAYAVTAPAGAAVRDAVSNGTSLILSLDVANDVYAGSLTTQSYAALAFSPADQLWPDVAAAGNRRLVAWLENGRVVAMRAGDTTPLDLHSKLDATGAPHVASNGTNWLVVWIDEHSVMGVRVSQNGALLDAAPIVIAPKGLITTQLAVSWDGGDYVVVFDRGIPSRNFTESLFAVRVSASGQVDDHETILALNVSNLRFAIAGNGDGSLIAWQRGSSLEGALLSRSDLVTPVTFPDPTAKYPDVAWNGDTYAVVYEGGGDPVREVRWAFVSASGAVRAPFVSFATLGTGSFATFPRFQLEPFADRFLLLIGDPTHASDLSERSMHALTFDGDGNVVDPRVVLERDASYFAAAGSFLVLTRDIDTTPSVSRLFTREITSTPARRTRAARH